MLKLFRNLILVAMFCGFFQAKALAHDVRQEVTEEGAYLTRPSLLQYGWNGFSTGLGVGLASGYLATGKEFESGEWKILVLGAGVGALSGIGVGLLFGLADVGAAPDIPGAIVLRDMGYGESLGALAGLVVGALIAIDSGSLRDVVVGGAVGTLVGTGTGLILGVIEAVATSSGEGDYSGRRPQGGRAEGFVLRAGITAQLDVTGAPVWTPTAYGRF